jgi:hypothetical protein
MDVPLFGGLGRVGAQDVRHLRIVGRIAIAKAFRKDLIWYQTADLAHDGTNSLLLTGGVSLRATLISPLRNELGNNANKITIRVR